MFYKDFHKADSDALNLSILAKLGRAKSLIAEDFHKSPPIYI